MSPTPPTTCPAPISRWPVTTALGMARGALLHLPGAYKDGEVPARLREAGEAFVVALEEVDAAGTRKWGAG